MYSWTVKFFFSLRFGFGFEEERLRENFARVWLNFPNFLPKIRPPFGLFIGEIWGGFVNKFFYPFTKKSLE